VDVGQVVITVPIACILQGVQQHDLSWLKVPIWLGLSINDGPMHVTRGGEGVLSLTFWFKSIFATHHIQHYIIFVVLLNVERSAHYQY
jgi:hypothetical protein